MGRMSEERQAARGELTKKEGTRLRDLQKCICARPVYGGLYMGHTRCRLCDKLLPKTRTLR